MGHAPSLRSLLGFVLAVLVLASAFSSLAGPQPAPLEQETIHTSSQRNPYDQEVLQVHIDSSLLEGELRGYLPVVEQALRSWAASDGERVSWLVGFRMVNDPGAADILVRFHDAGQLILDDGSGGKALGTGIVGNATHPGRVDLTLRVGCTTVYRSYDQMGALARHEIGHALGLGHTERSGDIMHHGPTHPAAFPNPADILLDSPNPAGGRVAGILAPFTEHLSCILRSPR